MYRTLLCAMAVAFTGTVQAQDTRGEIESLKRRVEELEKKSAVGPRSGTMNPDISLILQGTAARSSQNPDDYQITGFAPSGGEVGPPRRGFSLGESELVISSNIDPYFRGQLIVALTPEDEVEVEEAFVQTLALGRGFTLKGGRFLSGIGYQNSIHQHAWDFQDAPLPYKAFLGGRLNDDGVQVKWVAPTDLLVELGAELGRGRSFPGTDPNRNRSGMWSLFGHVGGDVGANTAWRAGLSYLKTSPEERAFTDLDALKSFSGDSKMWIADFVVKYARTFKVQGEYFRRTESGQLTYDDTAAAAPLFGAAFTDGYSSRQSGWYLHGVYEFMPRWRAGYRYDRLSHGSMSNGIVASGAGPTAADFPLLMTDHNPSRNTVMVDWSPSEFSRIRLQLASDKSRAGVTDNQALLQFIFSLGAHGAHTF
ncbi:MAG TPA: hypothetical protein VFK84_07855 [Burkholderiales bacterium]|nr:hypothetical protein [Burkholderiales bacterium]